MKPTGKTFELSVHASTGSPAFLDDLAHAMVIDLEFFPAFQHKPQIHGATVTLPVPDQPFALCLPLPVPGFGHVYLYADNAGVGYDPAGTAGTTLNFVLEAATSRLAAVRRFETHARTGGLSPSPDYRQDMDRAAELLADARKHAHSPAVCAGHAMQSLSHSLRAGEVLVLESARHRIARNPCRPGFRFGCNAFGYPRQGAQYAELYGAALNFATLPFYRGYTEKTRGQRDFSAIEKILAWTQQAGIAVKGHPLVWQNLAGLPDWMKDFSFQQMCDTHRDYIRDAVRRFGDRVHTWDVINEAHDWANNPRHSPEQMVELTRLAADTVHETDPTALRIVNSCCTWSEYVASATCSAGALGREGRSVIRYLRDVISAGVDFDVIGIQMYYPYRDLFEINRHLDLFCAMGKPVHITELGVPGSDEPRTRKEDIRTPIRPWHGTGWSEETQADWLEGYYTICYAKPAIEAVSWWDFTEPAWYPHGGLVREDLTPKPAYRRLQQLVASWRSL